MAAETLRDWYYRRILKNIPYILSHFDENRGVFRREQGKDAAYWHCLRPLAYLYKNELSGNPYFRDDSILEKIIRQGDAICKVAQAAKTSAGAMQKIGDLAFDTDADESTGRGSLGVEWIPYNLVECIDWLGDELGTNRKAAWTRAVAAHLDGMKLVSNYISTAPNHFIWRAALLYRAGQLFDNAAWRRSGGFLARQVSRMQTADGYWDEAHRGQGPSPNYHRTHLHGLDLYYRFSGDDEVRDALYKGVEFAVRAAYPDGTPIETFDGRQPYLAAFAVGMAANALSRTPRGRRLLRNQTSRLDELGVTDATSPTGFAVNWYAFATTDFMTDCVRFMEEGPEEPLPQEADGHEDTFALSGSGGVGGGVVARRGKWFLAVSAAETDVPRFIPNVYITERQSGFSVRHDDAGVVAGGGNRMRNHAPLANAHVLTGWMGVDCAAGVYGERFVANQGLPIKGGTTTEWSDPVKCCYTPIRRRAELTKTGARLQLEFMHAHVRFDLAAIDDKRFEVGYSFESVDARKVLLQVPIPLFHPGRFAVDGKPYEADDLTKLATLPVTKDLALEARRVTVRYKAASGAPTFFTYALEPIKNWSFQGLNYTPDVQYKPLYTVGILSSEFAGGRGEGVLVTVEIE